MNENTRLLQEMLSDIEQDDGNPAAGKVKEWSKMAKRGDDALVSEVQNLFLALDDVKADDSKPKQMIALRLAEELLENFMLDVDWCEMKEWMVTGGDGDEEE